MVLNGDDSVKDVRFNGQGLRDQPGLCLNADGAGQGKESG